MNTVLKIGSVGEEVKSWQTFLMKQGLLQGPADGRFGNRTEEATKRFQRAIGTEPDGIVGRNTWAAAALTSGDNTPMKPDAMFPPKPDFAPMPWAQKQSVFGNFVYRAAPTEGNPEGIEILGNWVRENIVTVELPQLVGLIGAPSARDKKQNVACHRAIAPQLKNLWKDWEDLGLLDRVISWGGLFVPRFVRGSQRTLSNHAFGTAFDINAAWNSLGAVPAFVGQKGSVRELVECANSHGFYWGGHFDRLDGMHFEIAVIQ